MSLKSNYEDQIKNYENQMQLLAAIGNRLEKMPAAATRQDLQDMISYLEKRIPKPKQCEAGSLAKTMAAIQDHAESAAGMASIAAILAGLAFAVLLVLAYHLW